MNKLSNWKTAITLTQIFRPPFSVNARLADHAFRQAATQHTPKPKFQSPPIHTTRPSPAIAIWPFFMVGTAGVPWNPKELTSGKRFQPGPWEPLPLFPPRQQPPPQPKRLWTALFDGKAPRPDLNTLYRLLRSSPGQVAPVLRRAVFFSPCSSGRIQRNHQGFCITRVPIFSTGAATRPMG